MNILDWLAQQAQPYAPPPMLPPLALDPNVNPRLGLLGGSPAPLSSGIAPASVAPPPYKPAAPVSLPSGGLLAAPAPQAPQPPPMKPTGLLAPPQPITPMAGGMGAPQPISPLVNGGPLPELPGAGAGGGIWERINTPEFWRGLSGFGAAMLASGAPSTNPASGSFAAALGTGLQGFQAGQDAYRQEQRQIEADRINNLYKMQIAADATAPKLPDLQTVYDEQGRETRGYFDAAGNFVQVGGSKAPSASGGGMGVRVELPLGALKMSEEKYAQLADAQAAEARAVELRSMIDSGKVDFDAVSRAAYEVYQKTGATMGLPEERLVAMDDYYRFLNQLRNVVLMAAKGVQTEGDAARALQQFEQAKTTEARRAALDDIVLVMQRTQQLAQDSLGRIGANYGAPPSGGASPGGPVLRFNIERGAIE